MKDATTKRLIMAGALLAVAVGVFLAACGDLLGGLPIVATVACDKNGAVAIATNFVFALLANQSAYAISPKPRPPTIDEIVTTQGGG